MRIDRDRKNKKVLVSTLIKEKMVVLEDFGICDKRDETMKSKLRQAAADNPDKDPREVLDYYCRPIIQAKVNS